MTDQPKPRTCGECWRFIPSDGISLSSCGAAVPPWAMPAPVCGVTITPVIRESTDATNCDCFTRRVRMESQAWLVVFETNKGHTSWRITNHRGNLTKAPAGFENARPWMDPETGIWYWEEK